MTDKDPWLAVTAAVVALLMLSACSDDDSVPSDAPTSTVSAPAISDPSEWRDPRWGPLSVLEGKTGLAFEALVDEGALEFSEQCVTIDGRTTLVFPSEDVVWDGESREISLTVLGQTDPVVVRDGDEVRVLGGQVDPEGGDPLPDSAFLAPPGASCPQVRGLVSKIEVVTTNG